MVEVGFMCLGAALALIIQGGFSQAKQEVAAAKKVKAAKPKMEQLKDGLDSFLKATTDKAELADISQTCRDYANKAAMKSAGLVKKEDFWQGERYGEN